MKKLLSALLVLLLSFSLSFGQNPAAVAFLKEDMSRVGTNYHSYEFHKYKYTPVPRGYKEVYVSHYGRHGSRYMTYDSAHEYVIKKLNQLKEAGLLNERGEILLEQTKLMLEMNQNNLHSLSPRGYMEHAQLGDSFFKRNSKLLKGPVFVRAISSTSPRCQNSMGSFCGALLKNNPKIKILQDSKQEYMRYISNVDSASAIIKSDVRKIIDSLNTTLNPEPVIRPIVTDYEKSAALFNNPIKFEKYLHVVASIAQDLPADIDIMDYLPFEEAYKLWSIKTADLYLNHCNSAQFGDIRVPFAGTLVEDFITKADESLGGGEFSVDLRFGHDYPLMAFLAYLGIEGFDGRYEVGDTDNWLSSKNMHMGTNIQMMFYRGKKGDVIVKLLHNERETSIPALGPGPYYDWEVLKQYLRDRY